MKMSFRWYEIFNKISMLGIVPVIKIDDVEKAIPLARALCKGGIPVAEITLRTKQAVEAITRIRVEVPEMLVGAGTVLNVAQVESVVKVRRSTVLQRSLKPFT